MKCVISFKVARKYDKSGTRIIKSCNMVAKTIKSIKDYLG